jgi:uncharacterized protein
VKLAFWGLLVMAILTAGYLGVGLFAAMRLSAPNRQPEEQNPADVGLGYREVSLRSADGLRLAAWWVPGDDPSRAVVLVPGLGATSPTGTFSIPPSPTRGRATAC